jgi:transposase
VRPRRDFGALEARRLRAADMFSKGATQADVARELGVSRPTALEWYRKWSEGGKKALRAGRPGRPPLLDASDMAKVLKALRAGPGANGFSSELWTLPRVADVIEAVTGVTYHPGHVWYILRSMGWSRQRPARRAIERDDAAIDAWVKQRWPAVKKTPDAGKPGSVSKTRAGSVSSPR